MIEWPTATVAFAGPQRPRRRAYWAARYVPLEAAAERLPQLRQLLAQRALGEVRQYGGIPGPGDERPEHRAARDPEDVGRDRGQLDARVLEHLVEALRLARALLDLRRAVAREI